MSSFTIYGAINDEDYYFCKHVFNRIIEGHKDVNVEYIVQNEAEYLFTLRKLTNKLGGLFHKHKSLHVILENGKYLGDLKSLIQVAVKDYNIPDASVASRSFFVRVATNEMKNSDYVFSNRKYISMEFVDKQDDKKSYGKIVIELFPDLCPMACEHFIAICTKQTNRSAEGPLYSYTRCPIHRLVRDGWLQCGDVVDGSGRHSIIAAARTDNTLSTSPSTSTSTTLIPDESFTIDFGFELGGIVGLSNSGEHSNGSQFFITLGPCEWMNNHYVGIGRLLYGFRTIQAMNEVTVGPTQRPLSEIVIKSCAIEFEKENY